MPSGKELWLCHEHQMLPRVRVIDDRPPSVPDHMNLRGNPEQTLLHTLQTLKEEKKHECEASLRAFSYFSLMMR